MSDALTEDWRKYERTLLDRIKKRDQDLLELHQDFMQLQQERDELRGLLLRTLCRGIVAGLNKARPKYEAI